MRRSSLSIFVLPDEASAFQAYRLLQTNGISPEHLAIVGVGYSSPDRVGLLEPKQIATRKAKSLALLAGTIGSIVGLIAAWFIGFQANNPTDISLLLIPPTGGIMAGFCGAVIGALSGFLGEGNTSGIYRHYLAQGRYLLMIEGSEKLVHRGQDILSHYSTPKL